jgi:hypothetical protein
MKRSLSNCKKGIKFKKFYTCKTKVNSRIYKYNEGVLRGFMRSAINEKKKKIFMEAKFNNYFDKEKILNPGWENAQLLLQQELIKTVLSGVKATREGMIEPSLFFDDFLLFDLLLEALLLYSSI